MNKTFNIHRITAISLLTALMCVSAFISIPLPFTSVPLTAQTLIVFLIGMVLEPLDALFVITAYILLGLCGLPVFSGGIGGPAKLFGPTGGYIFSWLIAVAAISLLKGKKYNPIRYSLIAEAVNITIIYGVGTLYFMYNMNMGLIPSLTMCVFPYIPLDIAKCICAAVIAKPVQMVIVNMPQTNG